MTKSHLFERLASRFSSLDLIDTKQSVDVILEAITTQLASSNRVEIRGFGSFSIKIRPPRIGRNPKTGIKVNVPSKPVPYFKPGRELKERVGQAAELAQRLAA